MTSKFPNSHLLSTLKSLLPIGQQGSTKALVWLLVAQSGLSLIVSGCSPTNSANFSVKSVSDHQDSSTAQSSAPEKQTVVRIGYIKGSLSAIAKERGTLERELALLIELLPPLIPPKIGGKPENLVPSPIHRGGLGWGKKIFDTSIMTFQTSS